MKRFCILLLGAFALLVLIGCGGGSGGGTPGDTYTVTFDSNGGNAVPSQEINAGDKATEPADPTQGGFDFVEWRLDGVAYDFDTPVIDNITLVANWTPVIIPTLHTVTFDSDGGSSVEAQEVLHGGLVLRPTNPTLGGSVFAGWLLDEQAYDFDTPVMADITLVADWIADCVPARATVAGEIEIRTAEDLYNMNDDLTASYILMANIDLSAYSADSGWEPIGYNPAPNHGPDDCINDGPYFTGKFEGNGWAIINLTIDKPDAVYVGLFGNTCNAELSNISLEHVSIAGQRAGGIVGYMEGASEITDSHVTGNITAHTLVGGIAGGAYQDSSIKDSYSAVNMTAEGINVGGIAGHFEGASIENSHSTGAITANENVGGIAGYVSGGAIRDSHSTGNITANNVRAGGVAGEIYESSQIIDSYSTGNISADEYVGGIVGQMYGNSSIEGSHSTGNITATWSNYAGGIAGMMGHDDTRDGGSIKNSYSTGDVTANSSNYAGGIAGEACYESSIEGSYSTGNITAGDNYAGGIVGDLNDSSIANSYSTANVTAENDRAGGIAGSTNNISSITKSYSTGIITANNFDAGGIAGAIDNGDELTACAAINPSVSGTTTAGRIVGVKYSTTNSNYARSDMQVNGVTVSSNDDTDINGADQLLDWFEQQSNYESMGWDFTNVWKMEADSQYPILKWQ